MALLRLRPAFRRFALALAAAQLATYALAPVVEAMTEREPGPVHVESSESKPCAPVHAPATCMACQLLVLSAQKADSSVRQPQADDRAAVLDEAATQMPSRAPPLTYLTRAPPALA